MALTTRQTNLLVQQDWTKVYQTFQNADFTSYDFETLRKTMIDYLRTTYPEDFNDFTDSSEYIALIDLIAFMGQSLAFRADLNARENFIDTAQRQDSVFKLARLVGYSPKRNTAAQGVLKIESISTSEQIFDSNGTDLTNLIIGWNDSANENWHEQMTAILNAGLVNSQVIGKPGSTATINSIQTDTYSFNIVPGQTPVYSFNASVENRTMTFEAVSAITTGRDYIYEPAPVPKSIFNILYRNDNLGNGSNNTGFFISFKQGSLNKIDFSLGESIPNRTVNVNFNNINNSDAWLYGTNAQGVANQYWSQVAAVAGTNVAYSQTANRNIYQINTRANDQVDLVFGDGVFANIPQGNFTFYYRQSNGLNYKITPDEISKVNIPVSYVSRTGRVETMTLTASLRYTVTNSSASESLADVRANAPQQYYTQNRMITGEDYNILPFSLFNSVVKVKAVNRTSSGVSRFLDVLDVTGKYSSTNIFCDDGYLYRDTNSTDSFNFSFSTIGDVNNVIYNKIRPILTAQKFTHFRYNSTPRYTLSTDTSGLVYWNSLTAFTNGGTGQLESSPPASTTSVGTALSVGTGLAAPTSHRNMISQGAMIKFTAPSGYFFSAQNTIKAGTAQYQGERNYIYAAVMAVNLTTRQLTLNAHLPDGAIASHVIPTQATDFVSDSKVNQYTDPDSIATISRISNLIRSYQSFAIRYDLTIGTFRIITSTNINIGGMFDLDNAGDASGKALDASWLILATYNNNQFTVTNRGLSYVFESVGETTFYYDTNLKVYDSKLARTLHDQITVLKINQAPDGTAAIGQNIIWQIYSNVVSSDGYKDPTRVLITFPDSNNDGVPDDPDLFDTIVNPTVNTSNKVVFFKQQVDLNNDAFVNTIPVDRSTVVTDYITLADIKLHGDAYIPGQIFYATAENKFYSLVSTNPTVTSDALTAYMAYSGRQQLSFQYQHVSPNNRRIDPSPNNIMDLFILTKDYSTSYQAWIRDTSGTVTEPTVLSNEELSSAYSTLNNYKALSDSIVYNPATFKPLFGDKADASLRAKFKVVANPNIVTSDFEIKSAVIAAINAYFTIDNWDFGETFYFSELSAYLHQALTPIVASIIIVPADPSIQFGAMYQVNADSNEIITSAATVNNVEVITSITATNLNQTSTYNAQLGI
jgi:hypothetical protein